MKILFIDSTHPILPQKLQSAGFQCTLAHDKNKDELLRIFPEFEGFIIRSKFTLGKAELDMAANLKFIGRVGAGLENIDLAYAKQKRISCFKVPEGNRDAVGEHALAMLLCLFNHLYLCNWEVKNGIWHREKNRGTEIMGKTVGIIGYGNMGSAFAKRLQGFSCHVIAYDKYKFNYSDQYCQEKQLDELFEQCDVLSLHVPQNEETLFMVNDDFLNRFKKPVYLINTARGKIVRTADLVKNLKSGQVKGACLDVLEYEKSSFENLYSQNLPSDFQYLIEAENVLLSPHVGGWTHESNIKLGERMAEKIIRKFGTKNHQ